MEGMFRYKSIYRTEVKEGDKILYWYKAYGAMQYCIAIVRKLHYGNSYLENKIEVERLYQSDWFKKWEKAKVQFTTLKSPEFLIVEKEVIMPDVEVKN